MSETSISEALSMGMKSVAKDWRKLKDETAKQKRISRRQLDRARRYAPPRVTVKNAAYRVMQDAYNKASANGRYPANARQIMYAARPMIIRLTGDAQPWSNSSYFTQTLLPDFMDEYADTTSGWDVVYDARGKLVEPHTEHRVDLGTLPVRQYIAGWKPGDTEALHDLGLPTSVSTSGPSDLYRHVLFIEKEGFNELLKAAQIADRYDVAIMSTKGMSVTASRMLVEWLSREKVTVFALRDFDKAGFSIVHTLGTDTRRFRFASTPNVVDLGLRLGDVEAMELETEECVYNGKMDPRINLRRSGATQEEIDFLVHGWDCGRWVGKRVELNAMTSEVFIQFIEKVLVEHGVRKLVPSADTLGKAYKRAVRIAAAEQAMHEAMESHCDDGVIVPDDLRKVVEETIEGTPQSWDEAVWRIASGADDDPAV